MTEIPKDLELKALEKTNVQVAVVCPDQESILLAIKKGHEINLINPTLIGNKNLIEQTASSINLDVQNYNIIETKDEQDAAAVSCQLANENKIKVIIKGNLHTDILMRFYLKKEFNLLEGKRLSHIWYMTSNKLNKPLFQIIEEVHTVPKHNRYLILIMRTLFPGTGPFMLGNKTQGQGILSSVGLMMLISS